MLSAWDQGVLAQGFGVSRSQVSDDAALITAWRGPLDDLLADLRGRHSWTAVVAYRYLRTVRQALRGGLPR
jgi:hypothetical protein